MKEALKPKDFEFRLSATMTLAQCLLLTADHENAAKAFQWVLDREVSPEDEAAARLGLADALYLQGKYAQAAEAYRAAGGKAKSPQDVQRARFYRAMSIVRQASSGEPVEDSSREEARRLLRKTAEDSSSPHAADASYVLALGLQAEGDAEGAIAAFKGMLSRDGGSLREPALLGLGTSLYHGGRHAEAVEELTSFLSSFPSSPRRDTASLYMARALDAQGKTAAAVKTLQEIKSSPTVGDEASLLLARICARHEKAHVAVTVLNGALKTFPRSPRREEMELELISALISARDMEGAFKALRSFETEHPSSTFLDRALYLKAYASHQEGKCDDSLRSCRQFEEKHPESPLLADVLLLEAESLFLARRHEEASASFGRYLSTFEASLAAPAKLRARYRQAESLVLAKKYADARNALSSLFPKDAGGDGGGSPGPDPLFATYHYLLGDCAYHLKDHAGCVREMKLFLQTLEASASGDSGGGLSEHAADARFKIGHSLQLSLELDRAREAYEEALARDPEGPHAEQIHFELGQIAYSLKEFDKAAEAFLRVDLENPASRFAPHALGFLGWMAFDRGDHESAVKNYTKLVESFPDHPAAGDARFRLASSLQRLGKADEAARWMRRIQEEHPDDARLGKLLLEEAVFFSKEKKHEKALAILEKLLEGGGPAAIRSSALYEKAWCHRELGQIDEAREAYAQIVGRKDGGDLKAAARLELAELEFSLGEHAKAKELLEPIFSEGGPQRERALYRLCWCHHNLKDKEGLLRSFEEFKESFPESGLLSELSMLAARAHVESGEHSRAGEIYRALAEGPAEREESRVALVSLGECLVEERKFDEARKRFGAFLERYPQDPLAYRARFGLGWVEENAGNPDRAVEHYRAVLRESTTATAARAQFQIGQCLASKKNYRDAVVEFLQVPAAFQYPEWSSKALLQVAGCFECLEDKPNARKFYKEVISSYPDRDEARLARERLARLEAN